VLDNDVSTNMLSIHTRAPSSGLRAPPVSAELSFLYTLLSCSGSTPGKRLPLVNDLSATSIRQLLGGSLPHGEPAAPERETIPASCARWAPP
jgi:hypothetical protein